MAMACAIRDLREERGLSVEELAAATSFHPGSISRMESGLTEPSLTMLVALSKALDVSTSALIERAELDSIDANS
jgi:transcriptional regulator with XRE-family HTH domain